jgi:hypothetical protein
VDQADLVENARYALLVFTLFINRKALLKIVQSLRRVLLTPNDENCAITPKINFQRLVISGKVAQLLPSAFKD